MLCIRAWWTSDHYISITHLCNEHTYSSIFIGSRHTLQWLPEKMLSTAYYLTSVIKYKHHKIRYMFSCVCRVCTQLYVILCDPMGCNSPGSSVLRISQARILEWVAISSSGDLPNSGMEPASLTLPALQVDSWPLAPSGKPFSCVYYTHQTTYLRFSKCILHLLLENWKAFWMR